MITLLDKFYTEKWMIEKRSLYSMYSMMQHLGDVKVGGLRGMLVGESPLVTAEPETQSDDTKGNATIIGLSGVIAKNPSQHDKEMLGATDIDDFTDSLIEAANDPTIDCIFCVFNSPGGVTTGVEEAGRKIKLIDETIKPIYAWTETMACSAAYWLMSQCRTLGMTESSEVGSIGAYRIIPDMSEMYKGQGINFQAISSGDWKLMGYDFAPLKKEEHEYLMNDVRQQHDKFKQVILSKRPDVKPESMEGLPYEGTAALDLGLVDMVCDDFAEFISATMT